MGKFNRGKSRGVRVELANLFGGYGIQARLDILQAYGKGRIDDAEKARLLALVENGERIPGYGDGGEDVSSRLYQATQGYTPPGRVRI